MEELVGPERPLYISTLIGGRTRANADAIEAVHALHRLVHQSPQSVGETDLQVDLIFQIPGDKLVPDFEGVRTGRISRRERVLSVQVAVPLPLPNAPVNYFEGVLKQTELAVTAYAARRKLDLTTDSAVEALRDASSRLGDLSLHHRG